MKKALFYTDSDYFSGAEQVLTDVADNLETSASLIVLNPRIKKRAELAFSRHQADIRYQASRSKLQLYLIVKFMKIIKGFSPDICVVNMQTPFANTWFLLACRLLKRKTITIWHLAQEKGEVTGLLRPLKLFAYRLALHWSDRIVCVSYWHEKVLINQFRAPVERVVVIINGVTDQGLAVQSRDEGEELRMITVGTLESKKRQVWLTETLKEVGGRWKLIILGDGPERQTLEQTVNKFGLSEKIEILGRKPAVEYLRRSDVLVHPSICDNLSLAVIEALSAGLPVIANDIGGNSELVVNGINGWLLRADDRDSWRQALQSIYNDRALLSRYGQGSRKMFLQKFTKERMVKNYQDLIDNERF